MADEQQTAAAEEAGDTPRFAIQKIYLKDVSLECPNSPQVFTGEWNPQVDFGLESSSTDIGDDNHEVVVKVTVTVKSQGQVAYLIEVHQAGIFALSGFPEDQIEQWTATFCSNILFPYVREAVSDLAVKGGFPQLLLAPVNFDAIYAQQKSAQTAETAEA